MEQRTPAWHLARRGRITGSNVGAILGLNPYRTEDDVLRAMVREYHGAEREWSGNAATEYGTFHEAGALVEFTMETGVHVDQAPFVVHPNNEWLGASPDGYVGQDALIEVKCPYSLRDKTNPAFKTAEEQPHYLAQMQVQMACTGRTRCYFWQWSQYGTSLEIVERDDAWLAESIPMLQAFHQRYLSELDNPEHLRPLRVQLNTAKADHLLRQYDELSEAIELASARKKEVMEQLVDLSGERDAEIFGRKLTRVERPGAISYAKALKDLAPGADLTKYAGKPSSFWKLT